MLERADRLMYRSKAAGKSGMRFEVVWSGERKRSVYAA
jgi:hypothetical protein